MGHNYIVIITLCITASLVLSNENNTKQATQETVSEPQESNTTSRKGRYLHVDVIELPSPGKKTKRQIIKIPGDVSKVKLVRPPLNLKHNRGPQQFNRYPPYHRATSRRPSKVQQTTDLDDLGIYDAKKVKRNLKKVRVAHPFYEDEDVLEKKVKNVREGSKTKRKNSKVVLDEYLNKYEVDGRKEKHEEGHILKDGYKVGEETVYGYDQSASSIHMKQVPAPNLFGLKTVEAPGLLHQSFHQEKFGDNYIPGLNIKKFPLKGRQMQSLFSQQYTTHNPHVATNFGLNGYQYLPKTTFVDTTHYGLATTLGKFGQPGVAASDNVVTALPGLTPGIQVIQPPQFSHSRDVTVSHPSSQPSRLMTSSSSSQKQEEISSQRATIRDILEQDCPSYDSKGYCESPPRYPMQQISNMVKKCANFMEVMNTQPFEEPHDIYAFAKRSDHHVETDNKNSSDSSSDTISSWSRSGNDASTACLSDLTITEPGYAKEVTSGRWFVIVQHSETTIQRIATDTCRNPGKPCSGLAGLKCNKINGFPGKSTRCIQRFTYQRLVSWDPESPDGCPRIRLFRFPSACVCHLS